jgi:2-hydroxy-4-carboxymuconate semialdehyde hemiacetal dehydrogenase
MNICMVGYGMMGTWHSNALKPTHARLHTLVGRRPDAAAEFAAQHGYRRWTTELKEALADQEIDAVILANPSEHHAETAIASLAHGKHTLVEIPIAMNLSDAERVVAYANQSGLGFGVVHPMRARPEMIALRARVDAGQEQIRHIAGRFFIYRHENVGATGYRRSWTDNLLWHHVTHLLDLAVWLVNAPVRLTYSFMSPVDPNTGTPMDVVLCAETDAKQTIVCTGSYYGRERIMDMLIVTDRDTYRIDVFASTLTTGAGTQPIEREDLNCARVSVDFVDAVKAGRTPMVTGDSVLPTMRLLEEIQGAWDQDHGAQSIPGRKLKSGGVEFGSVKL